MLCEHEAFARVSMTVPVRAMIPTGEAFRVADVWGAGDSTVIKYAHAVADAIVAEFKREVFQLPDDLECLRIAKAIYEARGLPGMKLFSLMRSIPLISAL